MKIKKMRIINFLKIGILLFGISLFLVNCEKDEILEETNEIIQKPQNSEIKIERVPFSTLEERNSLGESINLIDRYLDKNTRDNNTFARSEENGFTILTDEVIIMTKDDVETYTFQIENIEGIEGFRNFVINKFPSHLEYYLLYYTENQDSSNSTHSLYSFDILNEEDLILNDINIQAREGEGSIGGPGQDPEEVPLDGGSGDGSGCETIYYGACNNGGYHNGASWCQHSGGIHGANNCDSLCSGPLSWSVDFSSCDTGGSGGSNTNPPDPIDNDPPNTGGGSTTPTGDRIINTLPTPPINEDGSSAAPQSLISMLGITDQTQIGWIYDINNIEAVDNIWIYGQTNNWSDEVVSSVNVAINLLSNGILTENQKLEQFKIAYNNFDPILPNNTSQNDYETKIREYATSFKQWGNIEFGNYLESLLPLDPSFSDEDYRILYETVREKTGDLAWDYLRAIVGQTVESFKPVIQVALISVGGGLAIKLLQRLPSAYITTHIANVIARLGVPASTAFTAFQHAQKFGLQTYAQLQQEFINLGLTANGLGVNSHHLIEQRFKDIPAVQSWLGSNTAAWKSIVLTPQEHQVFTNAWRTAISTDNMVNPGWTGAYTSDATLENIKEAARQIYVNYPEILQALGL